MVIKPTQKDILDIHNLYYEYCKLIKFDVLPVLTLSRQEQKLACIEPSKYYNAAKKNRIYGQCIFRDDNLNSIIYLNLEKLSKIYGLHCWSHKWLIECSIKNCKVRGPHKHSIGHLEHTLIHELIHAKYGTSLKHGFKFRQEILKYYNKRNGTNIKRLEHS